MLNATERPIEGLEALGPSMHEGGGLARETEIRAARARYRWEQRETIRKAWWEHVECDREAIEGLEALGPSMHEGGRFSARNRNSSRSGSISVESAGNDRKGRVGAC
jgi:hypothetical protein